MGLDLKFLIVVSQCIPSGRKDKKATEGVVVIRIISESAVCVCVCVCVVSWVFSLLCIVTTLWVCLCIFACASVLSCVSCRRVGAQLIGALIPLGL